MLISHLFSRVFLIGIAAVLTFVGCVSDRLEPEHNASSEISVGTSTATDGASTTTSSEEASSPGTTEAVDTSTPLDVNITPSPDALTAQAQSWLSSIGISTEDPNYQEYLLAYSIATQDRPGTNFEGVVNFPYTVPGSDDEVLAGVKLAASGTEDDEKYGCALIYTGQDNLLTLSNHAAGSNYQEISYEGMTLYQEVVGEEVLGYFDPATLQYFTHLEEVYYVLNGTGDARFFRSEIDDQGQYDVYHITESGVAFLPAETLDYLDEGARLVEDELENEKIGVFLKHGDGGELQLIGEEWVEVETFDYPAEYSIYQGMGYNPEIVKDEKTGEVRMYITIPGVGHNNVTDELHIYQFEDQVQLIDTIIGNPEDKLVEARQVAAVNNEGVWENRSLYDGHSLVIIKEGKLVDAFEALVAPGEVGLIYGQGVKVNPDLAAEFYEKMMSSVRVSFIPDISGELVGRLGYVSLCTRYVYGVTDTAPYGGAKEFPRVNLDRIGLVLVGPNELQANNYSAAAILLNDLYDNNTDSVILGYGLVLGFGLHNGRLVFIMASDSQEAHGGPHMTPRVPWESGGKLKDNAPDIIEGFISTTLANFESVSSARANAGANEWYVRPSFVYKNDQPLPYDENYISSK